MTAEQKKKGRQSGRGSRKGKKNSKLGKKARWISRIRVQRSFLKELKDKPIIALIFGSYTNGTYTMESDIDILLVFQKIDDSKHIENTAKKIGMKTNTQLNPIYLDYNSFKELFHNPTKEFFKKLKIDKIIIIGIEWWRQLNDEEA